MVSLSVGKEGADLRILSASIGISLFPHWLALYAGVINQTQCCILTDGAMTITVFPYPIIR